MLNKIKIKNWQKLRENKLEKMMKPVQAYWVVNKLKNQQLLFMAMEKWMVAKDHMLKSGNLLL
jgi:hypothetical protein